MLGFGLVFVVRSCKNLRVGETVNRVYIDRYYVHVFPWHDSRIFWSTLLVFVFRNGTCMYCWSMVISLGTANQKKVADTLLYM